MLCTMDMRLCTCSKRLHLRWSCSSSGGNWSASRVSKHAADTTFPWRRHISPTLPVFSYWAAPLQASSWQIFIPISASVATTLPFLCIERLSNENLSYVKVPAHALLYVWLPVRHVRAFMRARVRVSNGKGFNTVIVFSCKNAVNQTLNLYVLSQAHLRIVKRRCMLKHGPIQHLICLQ